MWNRKNSVAIQSYSAKANKPEPDENKRVSEMFFYCNSTGIRRKVEMMRWWYFKAGSRNFQIGSETATILNRSASFLDGPFYSPSNWQIEGAPRAFAVR